MLRTGTGFEDLSDSEESDTEQELAVSRSKTRSGAQYQAQAALSDVEVLAERNLKPTPSRVGI